MTGAVHTLIQGRITNDPLGTNAVRSDKNYLLFLRRTMRYATIVVSVLIVIAVLIPGRDLPDVKIGGYDKLIHMIMFATWAVAIRYDLDTKRFRYLLAFLLGLAFSALTEVLQLLVEGRSFDIYDMAADVAGLIVGLLVSRQVVKWLP
jgi:VanZ family protein